MASRLHNRPTAGATHEHSGSSHEPPSHRERGAEALGDARNQDVPVLRGATPDPSSSAEQPRIAAAAPGVGIFELDTATGEVRMDGEMRRLWGAPPGVAATRDTLMSALHPEDREAAAMALDRALDPEGPQTMREVCRLLQSADGEPRWIALVGWSRVVEGRVVRFLGTAQDLTERQRAAGSHAFLTALVEGSDDAIVTKTLDGDIQSWNPAAERLFGYAAEEVIGRHINVIVPPELRHEEQEILARLRRGERVEHLETQRVTKDGRRVDISLTISPIRVAGQIIGASKVARDITETKRAREALLDSEARLREADQRKDTFLALLGHELRNPLAAIHGATELVRLAGAHEPRLERACGVLERQTAQMARLVDGLLEVSRIARGKIDLEQEVVDLCEVLQGVLDDRGTELSKRGLTLERRIDGPLWMVGDRVRLRQILDNVVGNAIKFTTPPGRVDVTASGAGDELVVEVRDTGVGIAPERLTHIFEPFEQEVSDLTRTAGGLGLGLPIAKRLVELQRGAIEARSDGAGTGTTIHIRFPRTRSPRSAPEQQPRAQTPRQRILIVEDNVDAGETLRDILEISGHEARVVTNGPDALASLPRPEADVVFSDLALPGMNGLELARAVRRDPALRRVRLVATTGFGQADDLKRTREAGFDEHLIKPLDLVEVEETLRRLQQKR